MRTRDLMSAVLCSLAAACSSGGSSTVCNIDTDCRGGQLCDQRRSVCVSAYLDAAAAPADLPAADMLTSAPDLAAAETDWARGIAGYKSDQINQVRFTSDGGILAGGTFTDRTVVGGDSVLSAGEVDILIVRYSALGAVLWKRGIGGAETENFYSIALAPDDSVIVSGRVMGPVDFGLGMTAPIGRYDFFIAKYSATGTPLFAKRFGGTGSVNGTALLDADGSLIAAGSFTDTIDFGSGPLTASAASNLFVARYSAIGQPTGSRKITSSNASVMQSARLPSGELALAGFFKGTEDFGTGRVVSAGDYDCFLLKLKSTGEPLWARAFGGPGSDSCDDVVADAAGNLYTAGGFRMTADFGSGPLISDDDRDGFVAKYGPAGNGLWSRRIGGKSTDSIGSIAVAADGSVVAGGYFSDKFQFGPSTGVALGGVNGFVALFAADGTPVRARALGSRSWHYVRGVDTRAGRVAVGGQFNGEVDLVVDKLSSSEMDGYVLSVNSSRL